MRETWLIHLCTDWMGDDAWLWKLDCQFRKFNYVGDTHWMRGRVTRKYLVEQDRPAVDLEVWGENQRGEKTTPGHATVLLPSRQHGEVRLPLPPGGATTCQEALDALADRFAGRIAVKPYPETPPGMIREHDGAVLRLRFNRPERRNSLTDPIVYALTDTVDAAASDESVRVIHLEGEGDHFCSGFDLAERAPGPERPRVGSVHRRMNGHVNRLIPAILSCQTPIVCSARGWVIGLGLDILLGLGLRSRGGRRPVVGPVHHVRIHARQRRHLAHSPSGGCGPCPGDAHFGRQGLGIRCGLVGVDPLRGAGRRPGCGLSGARRSPGRRTDRRGRAHQAVAVPSAHR